MPVAVGVYLRGVDTCRARKRRIGSIEGSHDKSYDVRGLFILENFFIILKKYVSCEH